MRWEKPRITGDREFIGYEILAKRKKKYCWAEIVLWMTLDCYRLDEINEPDQNCNYCLNHMEESELLLYFEAKQAESAKGSTNECRD